MLEFKDRYSWNTLPLQIKCCIWFKRFQLYLIAEKKPLERAVSRLNTFTAGSLTSM